MMLLLCFVQNVSILYADLIKNKPEGLLGRDDMLG